MIVSAPAAPVNAEPVAAAGPAQAVQLGATITLDGSASKDPDGDALTYSWTLSAKPSGSNAVLSAATSAHSMLTPDLGGSYTLSLSVSDGKTSSKPATVTVTVTPPTDPNYRVTAGTAGTIAAGTTTSLGMPPWSIADGDHLSYSWTLTSKPAGSSATLASPDAAQPSLTPDLPGSYVASLVVSDGKRLSVPSATTINALDVGAFKGFVDFANMGDCNDVVSDLFLIDGTYVFSNKAGSCADASYSVNLFGLTAQQFLCGVGDTIAGPRRACPDASVSAMFDTIYAHRNMSDLGLGATHQVSKFIKPAPVPAGATAVSFTVIDHGGSATPYSSMPSTAIVRTDADWLALWRAHMGSTDTPALPPMDFSKKIVLALFYPQITSCVTTEVTKAYIMGNELVVEYTTKSTSGPEYACSTIAYSAAELIAIDVPADPSLTIVFRRPQRGY